MDSSQQQKPSKKRNYEAYTNGNDQQEKEIEQQQIYSEINQQYKQLYLERQQMKQKQLEQISSLKQNNQDQIAQVNQNKSMVQNNPISIQESQPIQQKNETNKVQIQGQQINEMKQANETKQTNEKKQQNNLMNIPKNMNSNFEFIVQKSQFFINKLKQYPKEEQTPYMLGFSDMFCKNPFYEYFNQQPERSDVQSIFMTTYGYETELLLPILKSNKHFVLANDKPQNDKSIKDIIRQNDGFKNWTLIHPPKDTSTPWAGAFHPKLWLIKFSDFLRVVIGSGNLHVSDWSVWSNSFWYQDFPIKSNQMKSNNIQQSSSCWNFEEDFKSTLQEILIKMMPGGIKYQELLKIDLDDYDYTGVKVILVSNIVGRYQDITKYGRGKLNRIVEAFKNKNNNNNMNNINNQEQKDIQIKDKTITYQSTSLGSIDNTFLNEFYTCVTGNKPIMNLKKDKQNKNTDYKFIIDRFKLIYPTAEYIFEDTIYGPDYASPVILNQKYYEKDTFPKQIFHQFTSPDTYFYHTGVIPHLKVMTVTDSNMKIDDETLIYVGSHNFTAAAWGRFEKDYSQIYSSNTELGVVYPPMEGSAEIKQELVNSLSFKLNAPKYTPNMKPFTRNFE